jgi:hypothetical protein
MSDDAMLEAAQSLLIFSSGPFYFIEKIMGHRVIFTQGSNKIELLVKWQVYEETWEPLSELKDHQSVRAYVSGISKVKK